MLAPRQRAEDRARPPSSGAGRSPAAPRSRGCRSVVSRSSTSQPSAAGDALVVAVAGVLPLRADGAVVERRLAVERQLDLAVDAADRAQQHVVGVVVGRRAPVGVRALLLVMPGPDQQRVADDDPAAAASTSSSRAPSSPAGSGAPPAPRRRPGRAGTCPRRGRASRRTRSASPAAAGTSTRRCRSGATSAMVSQSDRKRVVGDRRVAGAAASDTSGASWRTCPTGRVDVAWIGRRIAVTALHRLEYRCSPWVLRRSGREIAPHRTPRRTSTPIAIRTTAVSRLPQRSSHRPGSDSRRPSRAASGRRSSRS